MPMSSLRPCLVQLERKRIHTAALLVNYRDKKGLQGDTMIKGKHIFFLRLQLLSAALNMTHCYARERIFGRLET